MTCFRRCPRWVQRHGLCVRSDWQWKDVHHDGTLLTSLFLVCAKTSAQGADIDNPELKGLIPRITEQIFQSIVESDAHLEYLVKVSYMEIYLERIRDLLARELCAYFVERNEVYNTSIISVYSPE